MKILKHYQDTYTCEECGCQFQLEENDYLYPYNINYVACCYCPECGRKVPTSLKLKEFKKTTFGELTK